MEAAFSSGLGSWQATGFALEPSWRLQSVETNPGTHSEAEQVQHAEKIMSRITRLAKCIQKDEQVDSTGMLVLALEHQVQQNQEYQPTEQLLLLLIMIIHYTDGAGVLILLEVRTDAFTDSPRNT